MRYVPPSSSGEAIWEYIKLVLVVCMFFWFGLLAGLVCLLLVTEIE